MCRGIEDWCHTHVSHKWPCHLDARAGSVLVPHDFVWSTWKHDWAIGASQDKHVHTLCWGACQGSRQNRKDSQTQHPGRLICSPKLLFPDAARLWMFAVASSSAAAARGVAPAAFDPQKTSHYRRDIQDLCVQGFVFRPVVWRADGPLRAAVTPSSCTPSPIGSRCQMVLVNSHCSS